MSFIEWSAAFIYWLPGYGESLAAKFLAPSSYAKLRPSPDSYVILDSKEIFSSGLAAVDGDRERLTGYLLKTETLNHPIKHVIAGIPLAWRGILTGKYLAIVGLPCALILLVNAIRHRRSELLILAAPALTMIILYSMISVSVPRYNVYLIYYYAIATAWVIISLADSRNQSPPQ
jgi:Ca2+/Na+ antiporter